MTDIIELELVEEQPIELELSEEKAIEVDVDFEGEYVSGATGDAYDKGFYDGYHNGLENGLEEGYNNGYTKGEIDGRQAEYDEFWDSFQRNGTRPNYYYAFYYWRDEVYNPKYSIVPTSASATYQNSEIVDTKVDIDLRNCTNAVGQFFNNSVKLQTVKKLIVAENTSYSGWFTGCSKLVNLTIEGVIGNSINISPSPLTAESAISVINALKDYSGTSNEFTKTVTFSSTTKANLNALGNTAPEGVTWLEYVYSKGWNY